MKRIIKVALDLKYALGVSAELFPRGYVMPWKIYVRQTFADHPGQQVQAVWPKVGTVTISGKDRRHFTFEFEDEYADAKGYAKTMEGNW